MGRGLGVRCHGASAARRALSLFAGAILVLGGGCSDLPSSAHIDPQPISAASGGPVAGIPPAFASRAEEADASQFQLKPRPWSSIRDGAEGCFLFARGPDGTTRMAHVAPERMPSEVMRSRTGNGVGRSRAREIRFGVDVAGRVRLDAVCVVAAEVSDSQFVAGLQSPLAAPRWLRAAESVANWRWVRLDRISRASAETRALAAEYVGPTRPRGP